MRFSTKPDSPLFPAPGAGRAGPKAAAKCVGGLWRSTPAPRPATELPKHKSFRCQGGGAGSQRPPNARVGGLGGLCPTPCQPTSGRTRHATNDRTARPGLRQAYNAGLRRTVLQTVRTVCKTVLRKIQALTKHQAARLPTGQDPLVCFGSLASDANRALAVFGTLCLVADGLPCAYRFYTHTQRTIGGSIDCLAPARLTHPERLPKPARSFTNKVVPSDAWPGDPGRLGSSRVGGG
jgi:hypothetical protein